MTLTEQVHESYDAFQEHPDARLQEVPGPDGFPADAKRLPLRYARLHLRFVRLPLEICEAASYICENGS